MFIACAVGMLACSRQVCAHDFVLDYQSVQGETSTLSTNQFFVEGGVVSLPGAGNGTTMQVDVPAIVPQCGDGIREGDEDCDGNEFGSISCQSMGFSAGNLQCTETCTIESIDCIKETAAAEEIQNESTGGRRGANINAVTTTTASAEHKGQESAAIPSVAEALRLIVVSDDLPLPTENTTLILKPKSTLPKQKERSLPRYVARPIPSMLSASASATLTETASDPGMEPPETSWSLLASILSPRVPNNVGFLGVAMLGLAIILMQWLQGGCRQGSAALSTHRRSSRVSSRQRHQANHSKKRI
ncbi:MAG: hypothetical protein PHX87_03860 [Candidatus Peribacteraceae bacterium]|nr:hypothetical protein [Candidatus Peribacteraceae bacterium]MDD5742539.1 hypothetical protein [Candidatus Peribacteraceae bacterium]